ncbi:hypothetical protein DK871_17700 [Pseudomonas sp. L13]|nr:hypothetical protein [Pseudomonas sp. L13]
MQLGVGRSNPVAELAATAQRLVSEVPSDNLKQLWETSETIPHCRSELAREKRPGSAVIQVPASSLTIFASKLAPTVG